MANLEGKVAIVAGGGGIGGATARRLAAAGAAVIIGDLDAANAAAIAADIGERGGRALGVRCDIADEASVKALVETTVDRHGGLDLMHVNAADLGIILRDSNVVDVALEVFDRTIAVNLRGHLLCTRHAIPQMLRRGGGALVYTTSSAAFMGEPERPCYAMAKAGLTALMRHVASRWGKQGIRANAVAPGLVLTGPRAGAGPSKENTQMIEEMQERVLAITRSTRLGTPEDIAAMVAMLLSDDGAWINGQVISVDGGVTMR